ncbi:TonB-dependent receptor [Sphingobacteriaceae bacterium]|nr:TonB-dependent receptor [Sphingobacteriaceae bacterium]
MKIFTPIFLSLILFGGALSSQNFSVSGNIKDATNGDTLVGATIFLKEINSSTNSDLNGFFSLNAPKGLYTLVFSFTGYKTITQQLSLDHDITLNMSFVRAETDLEEVEINTKHTDQNVKSTQMGVVQLDMAEIKKIPAFMGEVDILKTIQLLPGIKNAGDGNTGFYVRGGGPDQNLILLDGANIYNASHLLGFFSVFNSDAISDITLYKGNMPAQYGGRLSSVLDISMADGNNKEFHVDGGIGLIASRLTIQGPILKNKASFIVSARRTYLDVLAKPYINKSDFKGTSYFFYDLNGKLSYTINNKNRLYLSGYFGRDKFIYNDEEGDFKAAIPWGNAAATLRWNHVFNSKLVANTSAIFTNYDFSFGAQQQDFELIIKSGITDYILKYDLSYFPNSRHSIKTGVNYIFHTFVPTSVSARQGSTEFDLGKKIKLYSHDAAIYVSDDWDVSQRIRLNVGLRFSNFTQIGPFTRYKKDDFGVIYDTVTYRTNQVVANYNGLEPRFSIRYSLSKTLSLKGSYSRNFQYIHLASVSSISLPTDVWMPSTEVIKPQESNQYALGIFKNSKDNTYESSVEVYYKTMSNQIEYKEGSQPTDNIYDNPDNAFTFGKGWAYGAEFFLKKSRGKFTGWIGYTLSWTWRQFNEINYGLKFLAKYDRRHDASLVLTYEANKKWNFGMVWVYGSGNRGTLPNGFFLYEGSLSNDYGLRNSYQFVPYHRMDLNATFTPDRTKKLEKRKRLLVEMYLQQGRDTSNIQLTKRWNRNFSNSFTISVFNVYNRYNPYFIYLTRDGDFSNGTLKVGAKQVSLFPVLPSVTWNFKF